MNLQFCEIQVHIIMSLVLYKIRLVNDHRPGRLVDLEILADFKIMVDRVENRDRAIKMTHIEAKSIIIWLRYDTKWTISASCVVMLPNMAYDYILGHISAK